MSTWIATALGIFLLWRTGQRGNVRWSGRALVGLMAMGWGLFNVVEGMVNHHILTIHHVRYDGTEALPWDVGFLVLGGLLLIGGWLVYDTAHQRVLTEEDGDNG